MTGSIRACCLSSPREIDLERPAGLAISPDGASIVVGDRRAPNAILPLRFRIAILDRQTLQPQRVPLEVKESALGSGAFLQGGPQVLDLLQFGLDRVAWSSSGGSELHLRRLPALHDRGADSSGQRRA